MRIAYTIARILLGLQFGVLGMNGFLMFLPNPPPGTIPPTAMTFAVAMATSHFSYLVFGVQVIGGILLLLNRYVPFALVMLAAVLANVLTFHITMWPATLFPLPIIAVILWFIVAWPLRAHFAPLFAQKVEVK